MKALSDNSMRHNDQRKPRPRPTISDVARLAGVSISTVSRVLNDTAPVSPEVEQRVRQAIEMLNYTPHLAARNLAVRKTETIGLLLPEVGNNFFAPLLRGVENAIRPTEYQLLVHASLRVPDPAPWRHSPIGEHNADGMLVFVSSMDEAELLRNYERGFPMVLLFFMPPANARIPYVSFDNATGLCQVVEHLVKVHGRRRIVYLRGPIGNMDSDEREAAFRETMERLGVPVYPELIGRGNYSAYGGEQAILELIERGVEFDAIFAGDDDAATGVLAALRRCGRAVPEDVAVVGFDDIPFSAHLNPPLTTVHAPVEQAGYIAARKLLSLLAGEMPELATRLPVELVIRQSCGCGRT
uniref:LacI family transcriptional regulator n=1 Tax=Caldilinea aerophila TaxID=133453 RepID=A0A7C1FSI8_9CHLR